ncbi:MAG: hypothetical protein ABI717_02260 [Actinomycetota bacterium]
MSGAGVVRRGRQLCGDVAERLRSHGVELVPFLTVGCLVAGFWFALSLPTIVQTTGLRAQPAREAAPVPHTSVQPQVQLRVIASIGGATMPELRQSRAGSGPTKGSRERGETPVPTTLPVAAR